ncbi:pseudouridine synthase [Amylostereum chailletii]|nr:pseudouridine synthase [Amylostereum chailletii]
MSGFARAPVRRPLAARPAPPRPTRSIPKPSPLYVDRNIIVCDKPPGLVSQPNSSHIQVQSPGEAFLGPVLLGLKKRFGLHELPYPVHRLDKGTTGVLVFAKSQQVAKGLSQSFSTHSVGKTYLALARGGEKTFPTRMGDIAEDLRFDDGRVSLASGKSASGKNAQVESQVKAASTHWELLTSSGKAPLSLLKLEPRTGLKHQLRVHLASVLKAPILGDALYGSSKIAPAIDTVAKVPEDRMFLHAASISLMRYRRTGGRKQLQLTIMAPLPKDFVDICVHAGIELDQDFVRGGVFVDGERMVDGLVPDLDGEWCL